MDEAGRHARMLRINRQPLYTQAIAVLQELFEHGQYKPGDLLPAEDVLAKQLGISRSTLREALGHLETHGLVSRRQGIGTFVGAPAQSGFMGGLERFESFHSLAALAGLQIEVAHREVTSLVASPDLAASLNLEHGADLIRVEVVEAVNGRPCAYLDTYLSAQFVELKTVAEFAGSMIDFVADRPGPALSHTRSEILAVQAGPQLAARLEIQPEQAVLHLREVYYSADGAPLAVSFNYFLTDQFRFYVIRRVPRRPRGRHPAV